MSDRIDAPDPSGMPPFAGVLEMLAAGTLDLSNPFPTEYLLDKFPAYRDVTRTDVLIPGGQAARGYVPAVGNPDSVLVWIHGGAFIGGDLEMAEANWVGYELAAQGIAVLSLEYRKALDGLGFTALLEDVEAGWRHGVSWATAIKADHERIFLGGASAGASLAASVALRGDRAGNNRPRSLVLAYPTLHRNLPQWDPGAIESVRQRAGMTYFSSSWVREMGDNLVGEANDPLDLFAFPGDIQGPDLPPTLILTAEHDSLRSSAEAFRATLDASGGDVSYLLADQALHGFLSDPTSAAGLPSLARVAEWIRAH